jgi:hypothetical protein
MDAIESLFRDSGRRNSALRPFETALHPPEDTVGYGWLYRPEEPAVASAAGAAASGAMPLVPVPVRSSPRRWWVPALLAGGLACAALVTVLLAVPL